MDGSQQNQKTVVAFIAGLLIGGLLVWIFSAMGNDTTDNEPTNERNTATTTENTNRDTTPTTNTPRTNTTTNNTSASSAQTGNGSIAVSNQPAGSVVTLGAITHPGNDGWIVVHDVSGDVLGRALGASRYSVSAGLLPKTIDLLRPTVKGTSYRVVFYSENGDKALDFDDDKAVMGADGKAISATFTAQ